MIQKVRALDSREHPFSKNNANRLWGQTMFENHRNEIRIQSNNDLSNSFIVSKAQREEGTHSKSQDKTAPELSI